MGEPQLPPVRAGGSRAADDLTWEGEREKSESVRRSGERDGSNLEQLCRQRGWCRSPPGSAELFPGHPEPFSRPLGGQSSGCRTPKRLCRDAASAAAETRAAPRLSVCLSALRLPVRAEQRQRRACSPGGTGHRSAPRARSPRTAGTGAARLRGTLSSRRSPPGPRPSETDFHLVFFPLFVVFFFSPQKYIYIYISFLLSRPLLFFFFFFLFFFFIPLLSLGIICI